MKHPAKRTTDRRVLFIVVGLVFLLAVVAAIWLRTPLRHHLTVEDLVEAANYLEHLPVAPLVLMAVYVVGVLLFVPVSLLIVATGAVFGAWAGMFYALVGALLSALVTYGLGAALGKAALDRWKSARIDLLSRRLRASGFKAMLLIRLVPVAPFIVINFVAGASRIRLSSYMIATAIGMFPGIVLKVLLADGLVQAAEGTVTPELRLMLAVVIVLMVLAWWGTRVFLARRAIDWQSSGPLESSSTKNNVAKHEHS